MACSICNVYSIIDNTITQLCDESDLACILSYTDIDRVESLIKLADRSGISELQERAHTKYIIVQDLKTHQQVLKTLRLLYSKITHQEFHRYKCVPNDQKTCGCIINESGELSCPCKTHAPKCECVGMFGGTK